MNDRPLCLFVSILQKLLVGILEQRPFNSANQLQQSGFRDIALTLIVAQRQRSLRLAEQVLAGTSKHLRQGGSRGAPASIRHQRWNFQVEQRTDPFRMQPRFAAQFADTGKPALGDPAPDASVADLDRYRVVAHVAGVSKPTAMSILSISLD